MLPVVLHLTTDQLTLAIAIVGAVALFAVVLTLISFARLHGVLRDYGRVGGDEDILGALDPGLDAIDDLYARLDATERALEDIALVSRQGLQRFAVVRYDAFDNMGGQLSFSAALLDDYGDGVIITSINGRTETRSYAKAIKGMRSEHNLSEEEIEALARAASGHGRARSEPAPSPSH
jgi:hypothetical protein